MKAEITSTGTLCITAESDLETFALKSWARIYTRPGEKDSLELPLGTLSLTGSDGNDSILDDAEELKS